MLKKYQSKFSETQNRTSFTTPNGDIVEIEYDDKKNELLIKFPSSVKEFGYQDVNHYLIPGLKDIAKKFQNK